MKKSLGELVGEMSTGVWVPYFPRPTRGLEWRRRLFNCLDRIACSYLGRYLKAILAVQTLQSTKRVHYFAP